MPHPLTRLAALLASATLVGACAFVEDTDEGRTVRVVKPAEAQMCTALGKTRVSVIKMARGDKLVREDLLRLARNSAAKAGADTIVPAGEPVDGEQAFEMFRCTKP
jgi:hypothetical protein